MGKIIKTISETFQNFAKLTPTNKLIVGTMAFATVLMFAVTNLYKKSEEKSLAAEKEIREILKQCQKEKRELETDYLNYLKIERQTINTQEENEK